MAQFNPSQILSQLPPRRNTLIDYDPVSLEPEMPPPTEQVLASFLGNLGTQIKDAYVQSNKDVLDARVKMEQISSQNAYRDATLNQAKADSKFREDTQLNTESISFIKDIDNFGNVGEKEFSELLKGVRGINNKRAFRYRFDAEKVKWNRKIAIEQTLKDKNIFSATDQNLLKEYVNIKPSDSFSMELDERLKTESNNLTKYKSYYSAQALGKDKFYETFPHLKEGMFFDKLMVAGPESYNDLLLTSSKEALPLTNFEDLKTKISKADILVKGMAQWATVEANLNFSNDRRKEAGERVVQLGRKLDSMNLFGAEITKGGAKHGAKVGKIKTEQRIEKETKKILQQDTSEAEPTTLKDKLDVALGRGVEPKIVEAEPEQLFRTNKLTTQRFQRVMNATYDMDLKSKVAQYFSKYRDEETGTLNIPKSVWNSQKTIDFLSGVGLYGLADTMAREQGIG